MFLAIQANDYHKYTKLMDAMFRQRKRTFFDRLRWNVQVNGGREEDIYDTMKPVYLVWCSDDLKNHFGSMRLMPTTGPTLLYDVFRRTFPASVDLVAPGIWEGTRMCIDEDAIRAAHLDIHPGRAFSLMLLSLCECALDHGIHTMISNYEPYLKRVYRRAGLEVDELGRADGFGAYPVCCGTFEVSDAVLRKMRLAIGIKRPLYRRTFPAGLMNNVSTIAA